MSEENMGQSNHEMREGNEGKKQIKGVVMTESGVREEAESRVNDKLLIGGKGTGTRRGENGIQMRERMVSEELDRIYAKHITVTFTGECHEETANALDPDVIPEHLEQLKNYG